MSDAKAHPHGSYPTFLAMVVVSSALMFLLSYVTTYTVDDVWFSRTRFYTNLMMAGAMALVMLGFMRKMYRDRRRNTAIVVASVLLIVAGASMTRTQAGIGDTAWMKAMIPHHSIAILTSTRADLHDPRVRALADGIVETQRREIGEMEALIRDLERGEGSTARTTARAGSAPRQ